MEKYCERCGGQFTGKAQRRFCGRSCAAKTMWDENPEWRERMREFGRRPDTIKRLRDAMDDPDVKAVMYEKVYNNPEAKEKARLSNQARGWLGYQGGNGTGPSRHEASVGAALGWPTNTRVTVGDGERPYHYEIDVANVTLKIGVELDGRSHNYPDRQKQDRRKETRLAALGWRIIRFTNEEVDEDLYAVLNQVKEFASST